MSAQLGVKSSSGLFPAVLKEAELKGDYVEDVYLLNRAIVWTEQQSSLLLA